MDASLEKVGTDRAALRSRDFAAVGPRSLTGGGRPAPARRRHGARWLRGGGPGAVGASLGFTEARRVAGPEPALVL